MREKVGSLPHRASLFEVPEKLITQRVNSSGELIVCYEGSQFFSLDTTNVSVLNGLNKLYSLKYLLSLLNSKSIQFWYNYKFRMPTISGYELHQIPIRRINFTTSKMERNRLMIEGNSLYYQGLETRDFEHLMDFVGVCLPIKADGSPDTGLEKSDVVHDLLAFLADQMLSLNKQKQGEQKRFLAWLESELRIRPDNKGNEGIEALSGKTTLKGYLGDYQKSEEAASFQGLWDVLVKNKARVGRPLDATFESRFRQEHEKSLSILLPIKERLAATDCLIDQIVYKLYGLTEEEIAIVEGGG
jgi:hypothetical protein